MNDSQALGRRLRNARLLANISQPALEQRSKALFPPGISRAWISMLERGRFKHASYDILATFSRALGYDSFEQLLADTGGPLPGAPTPLETASAPAAQRPGWRVYTWGASGGDLRSIERGPLPDRWEHVPAGRESLVGPPERAFGVVMAGPLLRKRDVEAGDVCWVNPAALLRADAVVAATITAAEVPSGPLAAVLPPLTGVVVLVLRQDEHGRYLAADGELPLYVVPAGRPLPDAPPAATVVRCAAFEPLGPVVLVSPAPHPPR